MRPSASLKLARPSTFDRSQKLNNINNVNQSNPIKLAPIIGVLEIFIYTWRYMYIYAVFKM